MSILKHLKCKPFINVTEALTAYGGSFISKKVKDAMDEILYTSVHVDQLQAQAGQIIAGITHAESAIVTSGASHALLLSTAACIAKYDVTLMNRLPDTDGVPNEVIIPWHHITGYTHAISAAGGKIVGAGIAEAFVPANQQHKTSPWEIESKISERTAAIFYTFCEDNYPPLEKVVEIGQRYKIPVILDAAPKVPPLDNLYRFIDMGVDLVCISGGKGICGPQASGILCGRHDLIASAATQMFDLGGTYESWKPPSYLIKKENLRGIPERGIGRSGKVSKEAIVGLVTALEELVSSFDERVNRFNLILKSIQAHLEGIEGLELEIVDGNKRIYPTLMITVHENKVGKSASEVCQQLRHGEPSVYAGGMFTHNNIVAIHPGNLNEQSARIVAECLEKVLK
jgi:D-glucosaminate-6-phosphate ammonia-lyase